MRSDGDKQAMRVRTPLDLFYGESSASCESREGAHKTFPCTDAPREATCSTSEPISQLLSMVDQSLILYRRITPCRSAMQSSNGTSLQCGPDINPIRQGDYMMPVQYVCSARMKVATVVGSPQRGSSPIFDNELDRKEHRKSHLK